MAGVVDGAGGLASDAGELTFDHEARYGLAFSGGCDSSYLLAAMVRAGVDVKAYMVKTAFQADFEVDDARRVVEETGADFELIEADVLSHEEICENPWDRCYHCKRFIFGTVLDCMAKDGRTVLVDGTNASDDPARRPGFRALAELGVVSPLREAGLTKDDVRARSRAIGLSTADKPSFSCYATKVPERMRITQEGLARVSRELGHVGRCGDEAGVRAHCGGRAEHSEHDEANERVDSRKRNDSGDRAESNEQTECNSSARNGQAERR